MPPSARVASVASPKDYFALLKPRVMSLAIFTALAGVVVAPGAMNPALAAISVLAIALGAGAAGALNMWCDADIDAVMKRTRARPVPQGRIARADALAYGLILSALSVSLLGLATNYLAAGLLAFTIFFYVAIYSMTLKRATPQNIVIGGAAGALPPVVGWAAATGSAPIDAWVLFAIIFLWTPAHFWALALFTNEDYARARVPMLPVVKGAQATKQQILAYAAATAVAGVAPSLIGEASLAFAGVAALLGAGLIWRAHKLRMAPNDDHGEAKRLFRYSILYLFAIFSALMLDAAVPGAALSVLS